MTLRIDVYHHFAGGPDDLARVERTLKELQEKLVTMTNQNAADLTAILDKIDASTTAIGADIANLASQITTGMSQADVDAIKARLQSAADNLAALDAETPDVTA